MDFQGSATYIPLTDFNHVSSPRYRKSTSTKRYIRRAFSQWPRLWHGKLDGWRVGLLVGFIASAIVLVTNLALLVTGASFHGGYQNGIGIIAEGQSSTIERIGVAHHVLVNVLSTTLLTASNYCMQVLCAPTRGDVDTAHARGVWLDVGIISLHNLRYISRGRALSFGLLVLSSLPLHLFYNSAIFEVTMGQNYDVHYFNGTDEEKIAALDNTTQRLSNVDWLERYKSRYVSDSGDLFLGVDAIGLDVSIGPDLSTRPLLPHDGNQWLNNLGIFNTTLSLKNDSISEGAIVTDVNCTLLLSIANFKWPMPKAVDMSQVESFAAIFTYKNHHTGFWIVEVANSSTVPPIRIKSAWVKPTDTNSQVQISLYFMATVIICNLCKLLIIYNTLRNSFEPRLTTLGDAVSSFLKRPDPGFAGMCLLDKDGIIARVNERGIGGPEMEAPKWRSRSHRYGESPMEQRWLSKATLSVLTSISLGIFITTLLVPVNKNQWGTKSTSSLWLARQSFDTSGILTNAWLANTLQGILSYSYFTINRICTSMCSSREWNEYGTTRKGLRVTSPAGQQRKAFFLQLPYRWAIPLTVASCLLHWLASQAIFLSRLELREADGSLIPDQSKCTTGFSALSFMILGIGFSVLGFVVLSLGYRKVHVHMPLALHCSMVIAAACHPPPDEDSPHLKPVKWGVVRNRFGGSIDHCTFTGESVTTPEDGKAYS